ncbi:hypothetical protein [Streptosporangium sp. KLBMP 9127]|nr:hypothetical protein [Streptosporangium sp. KLBMP 9127]
MAQGTRLRDPLQDHLLTPDTSMIILIDSTDHALDVDDLQDTYEAAAELAHWDRAALEADPARWAHKAHHNL